MSRIELQQARRALAQVASQAELLEIYGGETQADGPPGTAARRRSTRRGLADPVQRAALHLNAQNVLEWHLNPAPESALAGRRSTRTAAPAAPGELIDQFEFEPLGINQVTDFLQRVDRQLNPRAIEATAGKSARSSSRLWRLAPAADAGVPNYQALDQPLSGKKRRLLWVHGIFSQSQAFFDGIAQAGQGKAFLAQVFKTYDEVLAFEQPTISVSPLLNALDLRDALAGISGPLDIIAHSRGGLVTRWAVDGLGLPATPIRALLVGSPLAGTSLAAPDKLRAALGLLSNYGTALQAAGGVASAWMPLLIAPLAILRVAGSVLGAVARTPILDGTLALVPGLLAHSRVENNLELSRLARRRINAQVSYFLVGSDFQPADPGWRFWRWFSRSTIANAAADRVFPAGNDLVVDTDSMFAIEHAVAKHDFGRSESVHHTNYFQQNATLAFIRKRFELD